MPEDDAIFCRNDYHEIYSVSQKGINKLRDVEAVEVDKFYLSKFLGKYLRIGGIIDDSAEHEFERDLEKIFNFQTAIENYPLWERVAEILVINERFEALKPFSIQVWEAISCLDAHDNLVKSELSRLKDTLYRVQLTGLTKAMALCWKPALKTFSDAFMETLQNKNINLNTFLDYLPNKNHRAAWLRCRMADKSVMPVLPDLLNMEDREFWNDALGVNLTRFSDVLKLLSLSSDVELTVPKIENLSKYLYHPYMITMHELSIANLLVQLVNGNTPMSAEDYRTQRRVYAKSNYQVSVSSAGGPIDAHMISFGKRDPVDCSLIQVGCEKKETLRIALANIHLDPKTLIHVLDKQPDRTYQRYRKVSKIVNQALDEGAEMLVMPEAFLPFEWLPILAQTCAKSQMAVVTGVEHLVLQNTVYNLTATILPFQDRDYPCAQICFHLKNHYAPVELAELEHFHLNPPKAEPRYELFCWNDCWFSVYCCYELCSIQERSLFQSYADFLVAVEWNRDVNHYGNIMESLARDMHCYCIQVNVSDYGDSRIVVPTRTENRDLIRTKGGKNPSVLMDTIDIAQLRDFQYTGHSTMALKPLPPQFDRELIGEKRQHILYRRLTSKS